MEKIDADALVRDCFYEVRMYPADRVRVYQGLAEFRGLTTEERIKRRIFEDILQALHEMEHRYEPVI